MQCPQCGNEVKATAIFCHRCGKRLVERPAVAAGAHPTTRPLVPPPDLPTGRDVHDTQPVSPVPTADAVESFADAETRELDLDAMHPAATQGANGLPIVAPETLVGSHYRIARVLESGPDSVLYEAFDLWAEDRCWACDTPWNDGDDDLYCMQCGAQRRGKMVLLRQESLRPEVLTEAATIAPTAIVHGDHLFVILPDGDAPPPVAATPTPVATSPEDAAPTEQIPVAPSPDDSVRIPRLDLPAVELDPAPPAMQVPLVPTDNFAVSLGESDSPTVEAPYFEATTFLPGFMPQWEMRLGVISDVGKARSGKPNEDSTIALSLRYAGDNIPPPLALGVVADGLGGHDDGQRAGRLAARAIARYVMQHLWLPSLVGEATPPRDPAHLGTVLRAAIQEANALILKANRHEGGDMGCTVTAIIAQGEAACVANVGDSRTYFFDGHSLSRVTTDHSLVARLVAAGMLTPEEVYTHPQRSQIYRSLGDESEIQVDLFPHRLRVGESFVLCSDGLWEMVRDPEIERLLARSALGDPQALAQQLVEMANANGGDDNVSVLVMQVVA